MLSQDALGGVKCTWNRLCRASHRCTVGACGSGRRLDRASWASPAACDRAPASESFRPISRCSLTNFGRSFGTNGRTKLLARLREDTRNKNLIVRFGSSVETCTARYLFTRVTCPRGNRLRPSSSAISVACDMEWVGPRYYRYATVQERTAAIAETPRINGRR